MADCFYLKRQKREGRNYGKWCVYSPQDVRVAVGDDKKQAMVICDAMNIAYAHAEDRAMVGYPLGLYTVWQGRDHYHVYSECHERDGRAKRKAA